jgi:hypothetical protein
VDDDLAPDTGEEREMVDLYGRRYGRMRSMRRREAVGGGAAVGLTALLVGMAAAGGGGDTTVLTPPGERSWPEQVEVSMNAARKGKYDQAWRELGWTAGDREVGRPAHCAATQSTGQVRAVLLRTPCRSLRRTLLAVTDGRGNTVVVSIAWAQMPDVDSAKRLEQAADGAGTGRVLPLASDLPQLRGVRFAGRHDAVRRHWSVVVIAEAATGGGRPTARMLDTAAQVAAEYPEPRERPSSVRRREP